MNFPIPDAALDDRLAILGTSGSGKTYLTTTAIERLLKSGARSVNIDPLGVMWGLRLKADGTTPSGFNIPIFGGSHGDLPLTEHAGALIGETVATMRESCIIDLSDLPTKAAERRFMTAFLESIYRHTTPANGDPYHLIIDEADRFAPQKPPAGDETMLNRMEEIVRRGRVKGFIPWMITQRPAVLNKNVLSQADGLVLLKLTSSQDRDQVGAWIEGQADRATGKEILASLPAMQLGQGTVWIPGRGILETVQFPKKTTFDSSRAPKRGEKRSTATLKPLNIDALKGKLAKVEAETKENDPKALKAEISRLKSEAAKGTKTAPQSEAAALKDREAAFVAGRREGAAEGFQTGWLDGERSGFTRGIAAAHNEMKAALGTVAAVAYAPGTPPKKVPQSTFMASAHTAPRAEHRPSPPAIASAKPAGSANIEAPLQRIVDSIKWWNTFGIAQPSHPQAAFMANYVHGSGTWSRYLSALRSQGLIEARGPLALTAAGEGIANAPTDEPSGEALRAIVLRKIDAPLARILTPLIEAYPSSLSHQEAAARANYEPGSGTWSRYLSSLRSLDLIEPRGELKAQDWMFP